MDMKEISINIGLDAIEALVKLIASGEAWDTIYELVVSLKDEDMSGQDKLEEVYQKAKPHFFKGVEWFIKIVIQIAYKEMVTTLSSHGRVETGTTGEQ